MNRSSAANTVLLDTRDVTIWRDVDGGFHICVGSPDDFRSVVLPQTVMQVLLRNLDELIGSGRAVMPNPSAATVERLGVIRRGIKELASGLPVSDVMMLVMSAEEKLAMAQDLIDALRTLRDQNHQRIAALLEWLAEEYEAVIRQQEREVRENG